jgi:hypothetical protein
LEAVVDLDNVLLADYYRGWKLTQQFWARDIAIRRNMASTAWTRLTDSVARRDCDIMDKSGTWVPVGHFIRSITDLPGDRPTNALTRWAVVIGEDGFLKLQRQALPLHVSVLNGKAIFTRYVLA